MVTDRKHYESKVLAAISERAQTIGLAREFAGFARFVGYMVIKSETGKELFEITLKDERGNLGNVITKSENVVKQLDDIMAVMEGESRDSFTIGFTEEKTKDGKVFIKVIMGLFEDGQRLGEDEEG